MINKKHLIAIDLILVVGSLFVIAGLVGYSRPLVIFPIDNLETTNSSVLFTFENGEKILIDDNLEFSSPLIIEVKENIVVTLKPGIYYWKIDNGVGVSQIRKLTIESEIDLRLKKSGIGEDYEVVNAGNTLLEVDIYEGEELADSVVLGIDESMDVNGDRLIGGQYE